MSIFVSAYINGGTLLIDINAFNEALTELIVFTAGTVCAVIVFVNNAKMND